MTISLGVYGNIAAAGDTVRLVNTIINSGFDNGETGWSSSNGSIEVSGGVATVTPLGVPSSTGYHVQQGSHQLINGNVFYMLARVRGVDPLSVGITTYRSATGIPGPADDWRVISFWNRSNVTGVRALGVRSTLTEGWSSFEVDGIVFIDLTECFGAGNEPSKEQMDALLLANFPATNGWFDGSKRLVPPGAIWRGTYGSSVNQTTYTFTGVPLGPESPTRTVFVAFSSTGYGMAASSVVTINGVTATLDIDAWHTATSAHSSIHRLVVPAGTTATIVASEDGSLSGAIGVWTIDSEVELFDTSFHNTYGVESWVTIDVPDDGFALASFTGSSSFNNGIRDDINPNFQFVAEAPSTDNGLHLFAESIAIGDALYAVHTWDVVPNRKYNACAAASYRRL